MSSTPFRTEIRDTNSNSGGPSCRGPVTWMEAIEIDRVHHEAELLRRDSVVRREMLGEPTTDADHPVGAWEISALNKSPEAEHRGCGHASEPWLGASCEFGFAPEPGQLPGSMGRGVNHDRRQHAPVATETAELGLRELVYDVIRSFGVPSGDAAHKRMLSAQTRQHAGEEREQRRAAVPTIPPPSIGTQDESETVFAHQDVGQLLRPGPEVAVDLGAGACELTQQLGGHVGRAPLTGRARAYPRDPHAHPTVHESGDSLFGSLRGAAAVRSSAVGHGLGFAGEIHDWWTRSQLVS